MRIVRGTSRAAPFSPTRPSHSPLLTIPNRWRIFMLSFLQCAAQRTRCPESGGKRNESNSMPLPEVRLVICEPFSLKWGFVNDSWFPYYAGYREAVPRVAEDAGAVFVEFQTMFDLAIQVAPPERWAADGVHPTQEGAALMAHWWLKAVGA
jgi:hypothetical protein